MILYEFNPTNPIAVATIRLLKDPSLGAETREWYCLAFVRQAVALGTNKQLYVDFAPGIRRWAVDIGRELGVKYPASGALQDGDLLFNEKVSLPYGHVAIYIGKVRGVGYVAENTIARRGVQIRGALRITPLSKWDIPSTQHVRLKW